MNTVNILGNNFSALYLAYKLIDKGVRVRIFLDGCRPAGHFAGIRFQDSLFDIGMVFLEQPSMQSNSDRRLENFSPEKRYDWLRYGQILNHEIEKAFSPVRAHPVKVLYKKNLWPDHMISDRLDILALLPTVMPEMFNSLESPIHAKYKNHAECYKKISIDVASIFNHGEEMHRKIILPFLEKITRQDPKTLMAKFHRALWLPLYWPETIIQTVGGKFSGLEEYKFLKTEAGTIAEKIISIEAQVRSAQNIEVITSRIVKAKWRTNSIELETDDYNFNVQPDCIGIGLGRFCELFGLRPVEISDTEDLVVCFFLVNSEILPADSFSVINILDDEYKIYRVSNQGKCAKTGKVKLSVEANLKLLKTSKNSNKLEDIITAELAQIFSTHPSQFDERKIVVAKNALVLPTFSNVISHEKKTQEIAHLFPRGNFSGHLLGYNLASLNDQMAQALQLYFKLGFDQNG